MSFHPKGYGGHPKLIRGIGRELLVDLFIRAWLRWIGDHGLRLSARKPLLNNTLCESFHGESRDAVLVSQVSSVFKAAFKTPAFRCAVRSSQNGAATRLSDHSAQALIQADAGSLCRPAGRKRTGCDQDWLRRRKRASAPRPARMSGRLAGSGMGATNSDRT